MKRLLGDDHLTTFITSCSSAPLPAPPQDPYNAHCHRQRSSAPPPAPPQDPYINPPSPPPYDHCPALATAAQPLPPPPLPPPVPLFQLHRPASATSPYTVPRPLPPTPKAQLPKPELLAVWERYIYDDKLWWYNKQTRGLLL